MVRNSPSAISSEMSRSTMFLPKCLATERMERREAEVGWLLPTTADSDLVAMAVVSALLTFRGRGRPRHTSNTCYCVAFTSFQISLYLARRGTFCQKYRRFW